MLYRAFLVPKLNHFVAFTDFVVVCRLSALKISSHTQLSLSHSAENFAEIAQDYFFQEGKDSYFESNV